MFDGLVVNDAAAVETLNIYLEMICDAYMPQSSLGQNKTVLYRLTSETADFPCIWCQKYLHGYFMLVVEVN